MRALSLPTTCQSLALAAFMLSVTEHAQADLIPKLQQEIIIDGLLQEETWQQAANQTLAYNTWPAENAPSPVTTQVRYFENGDTLYLAFEAKDIDPNAIRAFYRERDAIGDDDMVGVKIDPYNDHKLAYQFFVNPLGVQLDSTENVITGDESDAWDGIWQSAGQITDSGYVVEMAIPLRNFNFNPSVDAQPWAMEFLRYYPRGERLRLSNQQIDRNNSCWVCQMQPITGFANLEQGKSLALVPTLVLGHGRSREPKESSSWDIDNNVEVGLDLKWGITSDTSLNITLNPDFSQIEADSAQLGVNNNFTLFFPEKRAFFLENQELFNTNYDLVYTRNVGAPDIGAKLTGRSGKHAYGVFVTNDEKTTFLIPGNLSSDIAELETESRNAALRYRYDASKDLSIGWLGTYRTADNYHNYVNSLDMRYQITEQDTLRVQGIFSNTQYPDELSDSFCDDDKCLPLEQVVCDFEDCNYSEQSLRTRSDEELTDQSYAVRYRHEQRDWFVRASYWETGKDFRADLGFRSRADINRYVVGGGLYWFGSENNWWSEIELWGDWDILHNDNGELIERELESYINIDGPLQSFIRLGCRRNQHVGNRQDKSSLAIDGNTTLFTQDNCLIFAEMQPASGLYLANEINIGDRIDFANNRLGERTYINPELAYSFNRHFRGELDYVYNRLKAQQQDVFTAHQLDMRLNYNLDLRNSLRFSLIYTDIDFNPDNYLYSKPDERQKELATKLIYSYKVNPQTVFFAGYSDNALADDDLPHLTRDSRNLFMKFSYAWLQ